MIEISMSKYETTMKSNTTYQCNFCTMEQEKTVNKGDDDEKVKTINKILKIIVVT